MLIPRALVFITRGEDVLLIQGSANKRIWAGRYNGVGGHIERGEDPLSAARREVKEETGLVIPHLRLCGVVTVNTGEDVGIALYIYQGEYAGGELVESREGKLEWVAPDRLKTLSVVEDLPILLNLVLGRDNSAPPFSGQYSYDESGKLIIRFAE
jgi:8-oxo-dGTP diphosphatase